MESVKRSVIVQGWVGRGEKAEHRPLLGQWNYPA